MALTFWLHLLCQNKTVEGESWTWLTGNAEIIRTPMAFSFELDNYPFHQPFSLQQFAALVKRRIFSA
jgi:hypothetical protein